MLLPSGYTTVFFLIKNKMSGALTWEEIRKVRFTWEESWVRTILTQREQPWEWITSARRGSTVGSLLLLWVEELISTPFSKWSTASDNKNQFKTLSLVRFTELHGNTSRRYHAEIAIPHPLLSSAPVSPFPCPSPMTDECCATQRLKKQV